MLGDELYLITANFGGKREAFDVWKRSRSGWAITNSKGHWLVSIMLRYRFIWWLTLLLSCFIIKSIIRRYLGKNACDK
jgi:hypothetical protein